MSAESNKALVQRYYRELWNEAKLAVADDLFTEDYANYDPASPGGVVRGREGMRALVQAYRMGVPDLTFTIDEQVADGDTVVTRWCARGHHTGPLMGMPASGKFADPVGVTISRFRNGKIYEDWVVWDTLGLLRTIGVVPQPD